MGVHTNLAGGLKANDLKIHMEFAVSEFKVKDLEVRGVIEKEQPLITKTLADLLI
jgi:hypothetical protein